MLNSKFSDTHLKSISEKLIPHNLANDQVFWNENFSFILELDVLKAILHENCYFFKKDHSRNKALALLLFGDMCWKVLRNLGNLKGKDEDHFQTEINTIREFNWMHTLHSKIRHPDQIFPEFHWILEDPWPKTEAIRLINASKGLKRLLVHLSYIKPNNGFQGDTEKKQQLLKTAKSLASQ